MPSLLHPVPLESLLQVIPWYPRKVVVYLLIVVALIQDATIYPRARSNDAEHHLFLLLDRSRQHDLAIPFSDGQAQEFELAHGRTDVQNESLFDRMQPMQLQRLLNPNILTLGAIIC